MLLTDYATVRVSCATLTLTQLQLLPFVLLFLCEKRHTPITLVFSRNVHIDCDNSAPFFRARSSYRTDGGTDRRAQPVMQPFRTAAW